MKRRVVLGGAVAVAVTACGGGGSSGSAPPDNIGPEPAVPDKARFAQATGFHRTLLVIGQERAGIEGYLAQLPTPAGLMLYTDLVGQGGLGYPVGGNGGCGDAGVHDLQNFIGGSTPLMPRAVIQIGLSMTGSQYRDAANGRLDDAIRRLAANLRGTGHPVLLRPGYEAEGPWNGYDPAQYQRAFRRIVSIFRGNEVGGQRITPVDNVAFVWHLAAGNAALGHYTTDSIAPWYPGDGYVDWVAVSWFGQGSNTASAAADAAARDVVATFAQAHDKPLMIGESAPRDFTPSNANDPNEPTNAQAWATWYQDVLNWIDTHDVRVWSYINQNWRSYPMFGGACGNGGDIWGDSRVQQTGSQVMAPWQAALGSSRLMSDAADLWDEIGFVSR